MIMASLALMKRCAIVGLYVPCGTGTGLRVNDNHRPALVDSHLEHADSMSAEKIAKWLRVILEIPAVTRGSEQQLQPCATRTMPALNVE